MTDLNKYLKGEGTKYHPSHIAEFEQQVIKELMENLIPEAQKEFKKLVDLRVIDPQDIDIDREGSIYPKIFLNLWLKDVFSMPDEPKYKKIRRNLNKWI